MTSALIESDKPVMYWTPCSPSKSAPTKFCTALLVILVATPEISAQQVANNIVPDAPTQPIYVERAEIAVFSAPSQPARKSRINLNTVSIAVLAGGEALDSWTTYKNLTHPRWICGYSPALGNAVTYISDDGKRYDPHTIQFELCGTGPSGQLANYAYDVTRTGAFTEDGWVTKLHLTSNRNVAGVLAWNVADDVGQLLVARYLEKHRGMIRRIAPGINFTRGIVHIQCGILNFQFARTHNNPSTWQFHLPRESSLYPNPRWWGKQ
jgi:hypothetical protein